MDTTIAQLQFLVDTIKLQQQQIQLLREQISILKKEIE
jgi:hypothetical protein